MNFGEIIKGEIIKNEGKKRSQKDKPIIKAFLSGILRGNGLLYQENGKTGLVFTLKDERALTLVTEYLSLLFGYDLREVSVEEDRLNKTDRFTASICGDGAEDILISLGILKRSKDEITVNFDMFDKAVCENDECVKAFIRGIFITNGGCTVPDMGEENNTGYHLDFCFYHSKPASAMADKLLSFNIRSKIIRRKESFLVYIKSAEEIKDFIAFLPAPVGVLKLTDIMINRELTNNSNRQKNCDLHNVTRQVEASAKQIDAVNKIQNNGGLSVLKPDLKLVARARVEFPEDTLQELATRLNLSKSCINHRMRKIVEISEKI